MGTCQERGARVGEARLGRSSELRKFFLKRLRFFGGRSLYVVSERDFQCKRQNFGHWASKVQQK